MKLFRMGVLPLLAVFALAPAVTGCGHPEEEWQGKLREVDKLHADLNKLQAQHDQDAKDHEEATKSIDDLKGKLKEAGLDLGRTKEEADKLKNAVSEYEGRLKKLQEMEQRFRDLRTRLQKLTNFGLHVAVRNNRMVIQLPGDVLFDSGKDELKEDGKTVLRQVAEVINSDSTLRTRDFQVAGHTDNADYSGPFRDNWGLSLMRARQVLLFLTTPEKPAKPGAAKPGAKPDLGGGGLEPKHWAASGYGITDPQAGTVEKQDKDEMKKNRRVELVMQPNVEEMINLKDFGG